MVSGFLLVLYYEMLQNHLPSPSSRGIKKKLWSRGNIITAYPASPGSNPDQVNFLVEASPGFSLDCEKNIKKHKPHLPSNHS